MERPLLPIVTDLLEDGIICVDSDGIVTLFNRRAKEFTGVVLEGSRSHPAGRLVPGDVVLIADNLLGGDDGGMEPGDLACLGIRDPEILAGDAVLAAGVYQEADSSPLWRRCGRNTARGELEMSAVFCGQRIALSASRYEKRLTITVNGESFSMNYLWSLANTVVLDGSTGQIKFFQDKGFTIRRESLKEILQGCTFRAKGDGISEFDVVGRDFFQLFQPGKFTQRLEDILCGRSGPARNEEFHINKRLMICSMDPVMEDDRIQGAVIKLADLSELHRLLDERNDLIKKAEQANLNLDDYAMDLPPAAFRGFSGSSPAIQQVKFLALKAAQSQCNVILTGESGTGKSQLAKEIHGLSRPGGPFVEVNCSSIPQNLFESELFGYMGGAFTGALPGGKPGYFEQADGGTLFLDEIGEIPPDIQVKLLYVIQNRRFYRVGATKPTDVNVRILTATNRNLRQEVREGRFREDLYYRLNVFPIALPPLRERLSDIYLLSRSLMESLCTQYGLPPKKLSGTALEKLLGYDWPGNIRELGNVLERGIAICDGSVVYPEDLYLETGDEGATVTWNLKENMTAAEARFLRSALAVCAGNKARAMELLGLRKTTFYEKLRVHGIH